MSKHTPRTGPDQAKDTDDHGGWLPCVLYLRLSDARNEKGSFDDREQALRRRAETLRWRVVDVVVENDVINGDGARSKRASAFKRRRVRNPDGTYARHPDGRYVMRVWRPGFQSILADLTHGRANAVLAEDLDRAMRDPRDAQDLIDVIRGCGGYAESLSGSLKFTKGGTDAEIMQCEVLVSVARKSSADTARRVSDGRLRKATKGEFGGGRRPYGFEADGVTPIAAEYEEIQRWADAVLSGVPLRSIARDLITRDVPTTSGRRWQSPTVRDILLRPRNAKIMVHRGEEVGPAPWKPILPEDVWRAVVTRLTDPAATVTWTTEKGGQRTAVRGTGVGRAPLYLGTGLYLCQCGQPVAVQVSSKKARAYRCDATGTGHVVRNVAKVDALVVDVIVERLSRPDAVDLLAAPADTAVDVVALRAEVAVLTQRKSDLATDYADGVIDRAQLTAGTKRIRARLADARAKLDAQTDRSPLAPLIGADNVRGVWEALSLGAQRAVVANLLVVTIRPATTMGSKFDRRSVDIAPRG